MQENVLAEASMMIPDTRQRLETALKDLQNLLNILVGIEAQSFASLPLPLAGCAWSCKEHLVGLGLLLVDIHQLHLGCAAA
jgi:hypothetical protein